MQYVSVFKSGSGGISVKATDELLLYIAITIALSVITFLVVWVPLKFGKKHYGRLTSSSSV